MFDGFAETIRTLRKQNGFTQEDLARKLDVSLSTVWRWEHSVKAVPATKNILDLCILFHISINELIGLEKETVLNTNALTDSQQKLIEALVVEFQTDSPNPSRQNEIIKMFLDEFRK